MSQPCHVGFEPLERPRGVPPAARWFFDSEEWLLCERDAQGELHGSLRSYRADGTPWLEFEYRRGLRHGPFRRFYASGKLAQAGRYFEDFADGLLSVYSEGQTPYSIRECCIPQGTRVMKQEHRRGQLLAESFYAADGTQLFDENAAQPARAWPEPLRERELDVQHVPFDWGFSREPLTASDPDAARVEVSLSALRSAIGLSARRVQACREGLLAHGSQPIPPDVSALFAEALPRSFSFLSEDGQTVHVAEACSVARLELPALSLRARIEWVGLCSLCWAAGLDRVALPEGLSPRPELYAALLMASARQATLSEHPFQVDPGPHLHGLDETLLPASALVQLAAQYRELRAMLLFVSDPECQSPWQNDLGREAG